MPRKILIVGPSWVGDMVMAQSLFLKLKENAPDCLIDVLAPAWTFGLLERMPEVNWATAMPLTHGQFGLLERVRLGKQLRSEAYTQAIVLPNSWKSALPPFFAGIPVRTGYVGECRWGLLNDARKLDKQQLTMTVQRFVALGLPSSTPLPPPCPTPRLSISLAQQQAVIAKFKIIHTTKILALCPGAEYGEAKRWPGGHFAELARHQISMGWQVWLFGSEKDQDIAKQINQATQNTCIDFTGRTSLAEAVDLLSLAHSVVSNDSGLMHIAAALDKPVIALYGSSDPTFTPPLNPQARIISLNLACSPCFQRVCPLYPVGHGNHTHCLTGIKPERVLELLPP
ncbi:MAG: lipopolysaccharide heptosyltransferase II [Methylovulum sp.]|uniref:lipopolysaccharide heptosyltransferase II n=1 Tax=Methylovulum sp. TaxID=1916980 RepID=UPI00262D7994|nr:lipopolysaccharide heptosyltransferase II [Methylovulum sp.]MDD2725491.1 lipopolysaccharide heptosyltransferase II [Methylovulum sp.]MDD5125143.1 lipopolysaccharide heptosyltransferase II [Methylovulum sp.]